MTLQHRKPNHPEKLLVGCDSRDSTPRVLFKNSGINSQKKSELNRYSVPPRNLLGKACYFPTEPAI